MTDISALSEGSRIFLDMMRDIQAVSKQCGVKTYVWGGMVPDILEGRFLREHGDLDGFTEELACCWPQLAEAYTKLGYKSEYNHEFSMLIIRKNGFHAGFNPLEREHGVAMWRHIGSRGTVFFPECWLDAEPRLFYNVPVYTAGARFEYGFRAMACSLNPNWKLREKDRAAKAYLLDVLRRDGVVAGDILRNMWSYNPFWLKEGYDPFDPPVLVTPARSTSEVGLPDQLSLTPRA